MVPHGLSRRSRHCTSCASEADDVLHQKESATEPTIPDGVVSDVVRATSQFEGTPSNRAPI